MHCNPRRCSGFLLRRKLKRSVLVVCCCCLMLFVIEGLYLYKSSRMCSDWESKQFLHDLCSAYIHGLITGSLCQDLCNTERIIFVKCLNYRHGKVILEMNYYESKKLVLKTKDKETPASNTLPFVLGSAIYPTMEMFKDLVFRELSSIIANAHRKVLHQNSNALQFEENQKNKAPKNNVQKKLLDKKEISFAKNLTKENILSEITGLYMEKNRLQETNFSKSNHQAKSALMDSIWSVVQQSEYVFMKINQDWKFIPKIYGTCGKFYGMEYVKSGPYLDIGFEQSGKDTVLKCINVALQMLDMVQEMDDWKPHSLQMCDVKLENFGVSSSTDQLYTIDVDMFFFDDQMEKEIMAPGKCLFHQDCDFFDCKGWCHKSTETCHKKRINNNLQAVCEKIFQNSFSNGYHGLLHYLPPPVKFQLDQLLQECVHPPDSPDPEVHGEASWSVAMRLKSILQEANILVDKYHV